jgi:hypothetical protein
MYSQVKESIYECEQEMNKVKKKKTNFIQRWLLKALKDAVDSEKDAPYPMNDAIVSSKHRSLTIGSPTSIDQPDRAIQFTVYNANGGRVIETRRYDRHKDRHSNGLYVITSDMDFGREIDKIITMEALK